MAFRLSTTKHSPAYSFLIWVKLLKCLGRLLLPCLSRGKLLTGLNVLPISLLNTDLKLLRLLNVSPTLLQADKVGFIKGRQAADGTQRTFNFFRIAEVRSPPTVFLALDDEKAFDRVHWGYLQVTLTKFSFKGLIKDAIAALYTFPMAQVYTSNALSDNFPIANGSVPYPPYIFPTNGASSSPNQISSFN